MNKIIANLLEMPFHKDYANQPDYQPDPTYICKGLAELGSLNREIIGDKGVKLGGSKLCGLAKFSLVGNLDFTL